jgi:hypothetical protein
MAGFPQRRERGKRNRVSKLEIGRKKKRGAWKVTAKQNYGRLSPKKRTRQKKPRFKT